MAVPVGARLGLGGMIFQIEKEISFGVYQAVAQTAGSAANLLSGDLLPIDNISGLGLSLIHILESTG